MSETRDKILDCAQEAICKGGCSAFSFRTIAGELNIKSASVHYHFKNKDDLLLALTARYDEAFFALIGASDSDKALATYTSVFRQALGDGDKSCLCAILASEKSLFGEAIHQTLLRFKAKNLTWLTSAFTHLGKEKEEAASLARITFASLQGALVFSKTEGTAEYLDQVITDLLAF